MPRFLSLSALAAVALFLVHCSRGPYAATNKQYKKMTKGFAKDLQAPPAQQTVATAPEWVGAINFNMRKPNIVVIHHTAQKTCDSALQTFTKPKTQVSAHYVICRDGIVHHMLNDYLRAWHAGAGRWGNTNDINSASIGIELANDGYETFTEPQLGSLMTLLDSLKKKYAVPAGNFIGHADIAPTRKNDPNIHFPWKRFADAGYGHWWNDTSGVTVPAGFQPLEALRIVGYDVRDSSAVYSAFRRKYLQREARGTLSEAERKVLYTLYRKYLQ
ncbi:N-acetylmuramoyl-L-alanine amidase [Flaviaesturariibacter amylovorans]|uniref:N-acetylmuramoyl-L-alanine amidase n=1 Tax=Flaviaesturariibacter amylovorans TaxID=1084520 RepID=A0ABP8GB96_9BACT